jgi:hypothetical protein
VGITQILHCELTFGRGITARVQFLCGLQLYITYFDEVKSNPKQGQKHYLVGGIVVPADKVSAMEKAVSDVAEATFGTRDLITTTEFHASYCYGGKGPFKGMPIEERLNLIVSLLRVISETEGVMRVYAAIDTEKLYKPSTAAEFAFQHFVERVEMALPSGSPCLMIGDLDDEQATSMVKDFAKYRQRGTPTTYGIKIEQLVDSVHFGRSHHSRMLQLADNYMFKVSGGFSGRSGWPAKRLNELLAEVNLFPTKYKIWPNA